MRNLILICTLLAGIPSAHGEEQQWEIQKDKVIYEAVVAGTPVKVVASEKPFDPSKHKTTELHNRGTESEPDWGGATVDGNPVIGTDQTLPPAGFPQLARLTVHFGDRRVEVPPSLTNHIFSPHIGWPAVFGRTTSETIVSVSADGKCVLIDMGVGDGGGTATVFFAVSSDGKVSTEPPSRPGS